MNQNSLAWAGIVRVSVVGGRSGDSFHADRDQTDALQREADRRGVQLEVLPPELDVSGGLALTRRPSLLAAVEGVERGHYAGIMVAYLSRLGRNVREQLAVWDRVEAAGGQILALAEGLDTSTPAGRFQRTVLLAVAEMELEMHRERFDHLRAWATTAGVWQRRQTPLGYQRDPGTRRLAPDENADRVRQAFSDRGHAVEISTIARNLRMTTSGVRYLLRNRVYLGELRVGEHINPHAHPPLITDQAFLAAQHVRTPRPPRTRRPVALLAGLARCAGCGHIMSRANTASLVYSCHRDHSAGRCTAPAGITLAIIDAHVETIALAELAKLQISPASDCTVQARSKVHDAEAELARFLLGVSAAGIAEADYAAAAAARREALDTARHELVLAARRLPLITGNADPRVLWPALDATQRNRLLRGLIETVLVRAAGRGRRVPVAERVRVIAAGSGLIIDGWHHGAQPIPVEPIAFPHTDDPRVLGITLTQNSLQHAGS